MRQYNACTSTKHAQVLTSEDKHSCHNQVGDDAEEQEDQVSGSSPAGKHDLENGVDRGTLPLDLNGENREEKHLNGRSGCVPVSTHLSACASKTTA
jgi:hypothetical protein